MSEFITLRQRWTMIDKEMRRVKNTHTKIAIPSLCTFHWHNARIMFHFTLIIQQRPSSCILHCLPAHWLTYTHTHARTQARTHTLCYVWGWITTFRKFTQANENHKCKFQRATDERRDMTWTWVINWQLLIKFNENKNDRWFVCMYVTQYTLRTNAFG